MEPHHARGSDMDEMSNYDKEVNLYLFEIKKLYKTSLPIKSDWWFNTGKVFGWDC